MLKRKKDDEKLNIGKINEVVKLSSRILNVLYVLLIVVAAYAGTMVLSNLGIWGALGTFLKILTPFFIGIVIAWLLDPLVKKISKHPKINRVLASSIVYLGLILLIYLMLSSVFPVLGDQMNEFASLVPTLIDQFQEFVDGLLNTFNGMEGLDVEEMRVNVYTAIQDFGDSLTNDLPNMAVNFVTSFFSVVGVIGLGLIIGFYMLFDFDHVKDGLVNFLPIRYRDDANELIAEINTSLRLFVQGTLMIATVIFIISSVGFSIAGLEAPLFFAMFCGITNIIPYAGPYIGGVPAVIVGFSQGTGVGIAVMLIIVILQLLEGNILQPIIMGKTMKLHPVTIMIGLLVFFNFFGIVGMILATPSIAAAKIIFKFLDDRINFFDWVR